MILRTVFIAMAGLTIVHWAATLERRIATGAAWLDKHFGKAPENYTIAAMCEWCFLALGVAAFLWVAWA